MDVAQFDSSSDAAYLETLPIPSLRRAGDFRTAGTLIAPRTLVIHNTGTTFDTTWLEAVYRNIGVRSQLLIANGVLPDGEIAAQATAT